MDDLDRHISDFGVPKEGEQVVVDGHPWKVVKVVHNTDPKEFYSVSLHLIPVWVRVDNQAP